MRRWLVVAEDETDADIVKQLADRVCVDAIDWVDGILDSQRTYVGADDSATFASWAQLKRISTNCGGRVHGKFGRGHEGAARMELRRVQKRLALRHLQTDAVLAHRDTDGHSDRASASRQERDAIEADDGVATCLALPDPEMEAWLLVAWNPRTDSERRRLDEVRSRLGFDPTSSPQRCSAGAQHDSTGRRIDRNAKNVIEDLEPDRARAKEQLNEGPLDTLTERGRDCGLTEFLEEVKTRLVLQLQ